MNSEINILELLKLLIKKWWIIAICTFAIGLASYAYTVYLVDPIFVSQGMLYVNNTNSAYNIVTVKPNSNNSQERNLSLNDIYASQRLATTNIEILKSDTFMTIISRKVGVNYPPARLRKLVNISSINETEILQVQVRNIDPKMAANIVQAILDNANDEITRVINGGSAEVVDNASFPTSPSSPNVRKNAMIGLLLGAVSGVIIVYLLDMLDDHVKSQEELTRKYEFPVLGTIPSFRSSKKSGYYYSNYEQPAQAPPVNTN